MSFPMVRAMRPVCLLAFLAIAACAQQTPASDPGRVAAPSAADAARQEAAHRDRLAAAVRQEQRDEAWAARKEAEIRAVFVAPGLERNTLRLVECRTTRCELRFAHAAPQQPALAAQQQAAIGNRLADTEPCGYTLAPEPAATRAFLECAR